MIKLVAFLGNPGAQYAKTRHNVAWLFAESLPFYKKLSFGEKFKGEYAVVETEKLAEYFAETGILTTKDGGIPKIPDEAPEKIWFLKPQTYMNLSGESIAPLAGFFKINPEEILIIHDELELPLGTVSLKWAGGLGGHNGLRSAKTMLGTADFWRIRFGISKPQGVNIADYVLSSFRPEEMTVLEKVFEETAHLLAKVLLSKDAQNLLSKWSKYRIAEM